MSKDENKGHAFPEGYEHVQERLNETKQHLKDIDERIKNAPLDQGLTLQYKPPGFLSSRQPGSRDRTIKALKEHQDQLKTETLEKTDADTRDADQKTRRFIRDDVREELFPNPFRKMSEAEQQKHQNQSKDLETSQDFMDAKLVQSKAKQPDISEPQKPGPDKSGKSGMSMSARFSMSLGFTKFEDGSSSSGPAPAPSKSREPDKDKD